MGCGQSKPTDSIENANQDTPNKAPKTPQSGVPAPRSQAATNVPPPRSEQQPPQPEHKEPEQPPEQKEEPVAPAPPPPQVESPKVKGVDDHESDAFGLLLCGAGESGKTTFTRQLRLKYLSGFNDNEKKDYVNTIRGNLIETMQLLFSWIEHHGMEVDEANIPLYEDIREISPFECEFTDEIADNLKTLWADPTIQTAFEHKDETAVPDHMDYFFEKIDTLVDPDYIPTDEDVLRARIRTIGIDDVTFDLDGALIRIYDVGGQKNERKKWERVMSETAGCIFCVSFAEFDKYMFEEADTLRIIDALNIFEQVTHKEKFREAPFFLLCNKYDVFSQKIRDTDKFVEIFPAYTGDPHDPDQCAKFLIDKFLEKAAPESPLRPILTYKLVALDSDNVCDIASKICKYISENYYTD